MGNVNKAYALLANGEYKEAALLIKDIDISDMSDEDIAIYDKVREQTFATAAADLYSEGKMYYLSGSYDNAETALNDCLDLITDEDYEGDVIYYLGKTAEAKGETATAISYFQKVVNDFPGSSQATNAQNSLNTLNASVGADQNSSQTMVQTKMVIKMDKPLLFRKRYIPLEIKSLARMKFCLQQMIYSDKMGYI